MPAKRPERKYANMTNKVVCQGSARSLKKNKSSKAGSTMAGYCKKRRNMGKKKWSWGCHIWYCSTASYRNIHFRPILAGGWPLREIRRGRISGGRDDPQDSAEIQYGFRRNLSPTSKISPPGNQKWQVWNPAKLGNGTKLSEFTHTWSVKSSYLNMVTDETAVSSFCNLCKLGNFGKCKVTLSYFSVGPFQIPV